MSIRSGVLIAAWAIAAIHCQSQVTLTQVTNGLVDFYPLDYLTPGSPGTTPDVISRRDLTLSPATSSANIVPSTHSGGAVSNCFNLNQSGGATVLYYASTGQNPLDGSGDFLPFVNQRTATLNFWIKGSGLTAGAGQRFFGEADNTGARANPLWLMGTSSGAPDTSVHWLIRQQDTSGPGGSTALIDGSYELPVLGTTAASDRTTSTNRPVLDNNWHMLTITRDTNGSYSVYVDGMLDTGPAVTGVQYVDYYGNPSVMEYLWETNFYYTTNVYPLAGVSNPPPNGFVQWVFDAIFKTGATGFGGFKRGGITGGLNCQIDDIGFWNRALSPAEIAFVLTNGMSGLCLNCVPPRPSIQSFGTDFAEVGVGDTINLRWSTVGATDISISGIGNVTALGAIASTNVTITGNTNFTLTVKSGIIVPQTATVSILGFPGVDPAWHLVQRFDGLFSDTMSGIFGSGWISVGADFAGNKDRWNVVTITNSGGTNRVLTPRTGFKPNPASPTGFDSPGSLAYGLLNSLTIPPYQSNTLFFRFALKATDPVDGSLSDMDCAIGISDQYFITPLPGAYGPGNSPNVGAFISIIRDSGGLFNGAPFDLRAQDYTGSSVSNGYSYTNSVDPDGLQTNVNYYVWMDILNDNTMAVTNPGVSTNTINEAVYSVWLEKQGDSSRSLLFSGFHANRDYVNFNPVNDSPTPFLSKVFVSIASEDINLAAAGAYITTNMIAVDDFYLSKNGFASSFPKTLNFRSISRNGSNVTVTWTSFGSLTSQATNTYTLQRKLSLTDPTWTTVATGIPSGGDTTSYVDSTASDTAFYRVVWP